MKRLLSVLLALATLYGVAKAQTALSTTDYSTVLGTSAVQCVPADAKRRTLLIENPYGASTNNICYCIGASCTPVCGGAGTSVLVPGSGDWWDFGSAPGEPINCVASNSSTPVTIRSGR